MSLWRGLQVDNGDLRYRLGSGDPRLQVLLGGSLKGEGVSDTFGGAGAISGTSRIARAYKDTRLRQVASGGYRPGGRPGTGGDYDPDSCVTVYSWVGGERADATAVGARYACHLPSEGFTAQVLQSKSGGAWRPCVRLHLAEGGTWSGSTRTPFTFVGASADLAPMEWAYAPDMLGMQVYTRRFKWPRLAWLAPLLHDVRGAWRDGADTVIDIEDIGMQWVILHNFGGRSFAAGDTLAIQVYSHNARKGP